MDDAQSQFYRDQFRSARATALADAEGFYEVLRSFELIGQQLFDQVAGLKRYQQSLSKIASKSPLANAICISWPQYHTSFDELYTELRHARNDAIHQGAHARIVTSHAVEMAIILEDALMNGATKVGQFMVRDVVQAEIWQPLSYVRQQMLTHAYSYLPIRLGSEWHLVAEFLLARYLRESNSGNDRSKRLAKSLGDAMNSTLKLTVEADVVAPSDLISDIAHRVEERPLLVVDPTRREVLIGLLTSSDIL